MEALRVPMTVAEFEKLPEVEGIRFELLEGNIIVMAAAQMRWHSRMAKRLERLVEDGGYVADRRLSVNVGGGSALSPDVTVFRGLDPDLNRATFPASEVYAVIEVVSSDPADRDHYDKPRRYAHGRIPHYWIADRHPKVEDDAMVSIFQLTPADEYGLVEEVELGVLEERGVPHRAG